MKRWITVTHALSPEQMQGIESFRATVTRAKAFPVEIELEKAARWIRCA